MMKRVFSVGLVVVLVTFVLATTGCGRKSDPKPPEQFAPAPVGNLDARGEVDAVVLSWDAPDRTAEGKALVDLSGFEIQRAVYERGEQPDFDDVGAIEIQLDPTTGVAAKRYTFRDSKVVPGTVYEYRVAALNEDGVSAQEVEGLLVSFTGESSSVTRR